MRGGRKGLEPQPHAQLRGSRRVQLEIRQLGAAKLEAAERGVPVVQGEGQEAGLGVVPAVLVPRHILHASAQEGVEGAACQGLQARRASAQGQVPMQHAGGLKRCTSVCLPCSGAHLGGEELGAAQQGALPPELDHLAVEPASGG